MYMCFIMSMIHVKANPWMSPIVLCHFWNNWKNVDKKKNELVSYLNKCINMGKRQVHVPVFLVPNLFQIPKLYFVCS